MTKIKISTALGAHRDFQKACSLVTEKLESEIPEPDGIIFIMGQYTAKQQYFNTVLKNMSKHFNNCSMVGTQQQAVFASDGHTYEYGLRAVAAMSFKGLTLRSQKISSPRIRPGKKGKKFGTENVHAVSHSTLNPQSSHRLFFPPGVYFPPNIVHALWGKTKFNPLGIYNTKLAHSLPFFKSIASFIDKGQNFANSGVPFSPMWKFFESYRQVFPDKNFSGAFGINTDSWGRPYKFYNWQSVTKDLVVGQLEGENARFGTGFGIGIDPMSKTDLQIKKSLPGSIILDFNNNNNNNNNNSSNMNTIVCDKNANQAYFNTLDVDSNIWNRNTESTLGVSVFHPYCVQSSESLIDPSLAKEHNQGINKLDAQPSLYFFLANKYMKATLMTAPDSIVEKLKTGSLTGYIGVQSPNRIIDSIQTAVTSALETSQIKQIHGGLFIECSNRAQAIEEIFKKLLDEDMRMFPYPFLGLVTAGEIAPRTHPIVCSSLVTTIIGE